ncbi:hypothetical protein PR001_g2808 [Phytophthora rubi]|uniref:Uncharacterized protein n=1 Tax=Phytophthora rubi TaxID=129364 RepID=A0A6A3P8M1_9STRA|nr:hypothetical protein PR002_g163 [Phytophthora rubi]KAE9049991.1 hypothetical protein PR001_g2808 [Phytophthora rubi]
MSELSKGGTDEDREQGDMLLEGRDRLAELRERRRDLENGSGQRGMSSGESERLQQETQAAAFDLAHEAMSAEAVKAFVKLKRAEYAAKHAPLVAPTGAGMVKTASLRQKSLENALTRAQTLPDIVLG